MSNIKVILEILSLVCLAETQSVVRYHDHKIPPLVCVVLNVNPRNSLALGSKSQH
jgi:hypothetical protein